MRFEDFVESSRHVQTPDELARLYAAAVGEEGYENSILTSVRGRRLGHIAWFDLPNGYVDAYVEHGWDRIDPVLARTFRAAQPFFWSDVAERTSLSEEQIRFMEACRELKVHSGLIFPFHGPDRRLEVMSISRRATDAPDRSRAGLLHAISLQTWSRYQELTEEPAHAIPDVPLTARELEILRRCKDGKTRPEIGEILSISHKTVEFHLRSIMDKLGANNQISAVVIALQRGLIEL